MNEIKWEKFIKSCEISENSEKFVKNVKKLLDETVFHKKSDDIHKQIDNLLLEMTDSELKEAQNALIEFLLTEI